MSPISVATISAFRRSSELMAVPPVQPDQHSRRDDIVQDRVPVRRSDRDREITRHPVVQPRLDVDVQPALAVEQFAGTIAGRAEVVVGDCSTDCVRDVQK